MSGINIYLAVKDAVEYRDLVGMLRMEGIDLDLEPPARILADGEVMVAALSESDLIIEVMGSERAAEAVRIAQGMGKPVISYAPRKNKARMIVTDVEDLCAVLEACVSAILEQKEK